MGENERAQNIVASSHTLVDHRSFTTAWLPQPDGTLQLVIGTPDGNCHTLALNTETVARAHRATGPAIDLPGSLN